MSTIQPDDHPDLGVAAIEGEVIGLAGSAVLHAKRGEGSRALDLSSDTPNDPLFG
ncbi:MAG: hypothetical protein KY462_05715 [Actinobacteria bacterium]|nr:hypothetical protein [Actinomycetota bacterium]